MLLLQRACELFRVLKVVRVVADRRRRDLG